jgi:enoyl-CoA hydratase/carnithine racemase
MDRQIVTEVADGILRIQINRPEKKNALSVAMYDAMAAAMQQAETDAAVRVVVIHGHPEVFTSGNDLLDFMNVVQQQDEGRPVFKFLKAINDAPKPLVAAVNGPAVGIGTTMLLHCDLVYAGQGSHFQLPFVNLGLCPEAASSLLLPGIIGHQRAAELLLLGEPFSATKAREYGIVTDVVADGEELTTALAAARKLAAKPAASLRVTKMLMKKATTGQAWQRIQEEGEQFGKMVRAPEAAEAFRAFFEKRAPDFSKFD